jgi:transcriptional regulator of arginine metabolism
MTWRAQLPDLLDREALATQGEIARALKNRGFRVDQASISRELQRAGAVKEGGLYRIRRAGPTVPIHRVDQTAAGCLLVLKTDPAYAMALAQWIDSQQMIGVLGTVAGDDTVFAATSGAEATSALRRALGR